MVWQPTDGLLNNENNTENNEKEGTSNEKEGRSNLLNNVNYIEGHKDTKKNKHANKSQTKLENMYPEGHCQW